MRLFHSHRIHLSLPTSSSASDFSLLHNLLSLNDSGGSMIGNEQPSGRGDAAPAEPASATSRTMGHALRRWPSNSQHVLASEAIFKGLLFGDQLAPKKAAL